MKKDKNNRQEQQTVSKNNSRHIIRFTALFLAAFTVWSNTAVICRAEETKADGPVIVIDAGHQAKGNSE